MSLRRCRLCGAHREATEFRAGRARCRDCERLSRQRKTSAQPPPDLRSISAPGAAWHQCDGGDIQAAHQNVHRRGFWTGGARVIAWIETLCVYPDGPLQGRPVELIPWQREAIFQLFMLRADGLRQYRRALWGVAKKNAKTTIGAWLALYFLAGDDEPTPVIPCAAANDDQADLVFNAAKMTAELSPQLALITERWEREILVPSRPGARLLRVAAGGGNLDGKNISVAIFDELHEWTTAKSTTTFTVLNRGMIARRQPLAFMITTAGWDQETIAYQLYDYGRKVNAGEIDDPTFFFLWYEALETAGDYRSHAAFDAANPSAGVTVSYERFLEDSRPPMKEHEARRYHLNQWTEVEAAWLPPGAWEACAHDDVVIEPGPGRRLVAAIDAATKHDSTALVVALLEGARVRVRARLWERPADPMTGQPREDWRLPIDELGHHLRSLHFGTATEGDWCEAGACRCCGEPFPPLGFESVGYDPAFISWEAGRWAEDGLPMVEIPQTAQRMVPASQALYERIAQGLLEHDGDPALARHIRNAVATESSAGGWRLAKGKARKPMDAAIATAMCLYLLSQPVEDVEPHIY